MKKRLSQFGSFFVWACVAVAGITLLVAGSATTQAEARTALGHAGFSNIEINGIAPIACGSEHPMGLHFRATNGNGQPVSGVVCCEPLNGCGIRF